MTTTVVDGPFFEDLARGQSFGSAPTITLTSGLAAAHQAILGDRMRLPLDHRLAEKVCGRPGIAHPGLVWDVAIGQSTVVTRRVVANLFYRDVAFHRLPALGDTLTTTTVVVGLKANRPRADRAPTGLAALHMTCVDQEGRTVLDFLRCAMLPVRRPEAVTGADDNLAALSVRGQANGVESGAVEPGAVAVGWNLAEFRNAVPGPHFGDLTVGDEYVVAAGDLVSSAPELARLTLNVAAVHHDAPAGGRRLVYGGHTIGLALSQATRALPGIVTVSDWQECRHVGPVYEGDTLHSTVAVMDLIPSAIGGLAVLRSLVTARDASGGEPRDVLDWTFTAVFA